MKLNVIYNHSMYNYEEVLKTLESILTLKEIAYKSFELNDMQAFGDFSFVIGGDGTLLKASKFYSKMQVPVLGINLGRLGFLSQAGVDELNFAIDAVLKGNYSTEDRIMLVSDNNLALNDFVIKGCNPSRTSKFYLEINNKFVCDYIADGLIISTPTGSTAYGLSAGGPVVYPTLKAIVIVPICPHTLNARPLVVPTEETITVKTSDNLLSVAVDGYETNSPVEKISIKIANTRAKLAFLKNESFYSVLRSKFHWGIPAGE